MLKCARRASLKGASNCILRMLSGSSLHSFILLGKKEFLYISPRALGPEVNNSMCKTLIDNGLSQWTGILFSIKTFQLEFISLRKELSRYRTLSHSTFVLRHLRVTTLGSDMVALKSGSNFNCFENKRELHQPAFKGWRSGESTRLPPMWSG